MVGDTSEAAKDSLAGRFGDEDTDGDSDGKDEAEDRFGPANIKEEWTNHSMYLPDSLTGQLARQSKRADLDMEDEFGMDLGKTRHYYPLIVALGLEQFEDMDAQDIKERLEEIED